MLDISIKTIPYLKQRYSTAGDYFNKKKELCIRVNELYQKDYEFILAMHEIVEAYLCQKRNIPYKDIDEWDKKHLESDEPGALPKAPYRKEHFFAETIERLLAAELDIDWLKYEEALEKSYKK